MKKLVIRKSLIIKSIIIIFLIPFFINRLIYGTFNILTYPYKINIDGMRYSTAGHRTIVLSGKNKPQSTHEISGSFDKFTGKKIYYISSDYHEPGGLIYLYLHDDKYLVYGSGGGK